MKKVIETNRLYLREMEADDFDSLYVVLADSDIMQHYPYTFDKTRVQNWINKNIERYKELGFGLWAVCLKDTNEMIGDCGLTIQKIDGESLPEIGYHIAKNQQKKGYAKEAANSVKEWVLLNTNFAEVFSYMHSDNIASINTAKSIGMEFVKEYRSEDNFLTSVYKLCLKK